jgi:hypothetical protein
VAEGGAVSSSLASAIENRSCIQETSDVSEALRDSGGDERVSAGLLGIDRCMVGDRFGDCTT